MINISEEAKEYFLTAGSRKTFTVHFPNGEYRDLDNNDIVSESLSFQENLCQQNDFKFGLCEANHISFKTIGVEDNLKGAEIECALVSGQTVETIEPISVGKSFAPQDGEFEMTFEFPVTSNEEILVQFENTLPPQMVFVSVEITSTSGEVLEESSVGRITESSTTFSGEFVKMKVSFNSNYYVPSSATVSFNGTERKMAFQQIPLGRFTIDSCKRDTKTGNRTIEAYGKSYTENTRLSQFELWKRSVPVIQNVPYTYSVDNFVTQELKLLSNLSFVRDEVPYSNPEFIYRTPSRYNIGRHQNVSAEIRFRIVKIDKTMAYYGILKNSETGMTPTQKRMQEELDNAGITKNGIIQSNIFNRKMSSGLVKDKALDGLSFYQPKFAVANYYVKDGSLTGEGSPVSMIDIAVDDLLHYYISGVNNTRTDGKISQEYIVLFPYAIYLYDSNDNVEAYNVMYFTDPKISLYTPRTYLEYFQRSIPRTKTGKITVKVSGSTYTATSYFAPPKELDISSEGLVNDYLEMNARFGKFNRYNEGKMLRLGDGVLFPDNGYMYPFPEDSLYPENGNLFTVFPSEYFNCEVEEDVSYKIGAVKYDYLTTDDNGNEIVATNVINFDDSALDTYYIKDNKLLTSQSITEDEADTLVRANFISKARGITWTPLTVDMIGIPWVEAGDRLTVATKGESISTYVFSRTLKGIQALRDSVESDVLLEE